MVPPIDEDMLFLSPAIKLFPELLKAESRGVVLTGELPEFFSFCPCLAGGEGVQECVGTTQSSLNSSDKV